MKKIILLFIVAVMLTFTMNNKADAVNAVDTIQYSNQAAGDHFYNVADGHVSHDTYRWYDEDWEWAHNAITTSIDISATLNVSAWDVDKTSGEVDNIYAYDGGGGGLGWTLLGSLNGSNNTWDFTVFNLSSAFYDDIFTGLRVKIDIDSTNTVDTWAVSLAKSTLCIDECTKPDPNPGVVPEPSTYLLLGSGIAGLAFWRRRQKAKKA
ncbi:hypothetical protein MNBD_DELTA01-876 [hydrothermal vent metagenome]|uniref:Ice-binding protein C-terminal domain-containing protein n=1 Tax=hydrothermal vent metagenome TaxID=652676 RepID=A0A3B0QWM7_9ZZZZ